MWENKFTKKNISFWLITIGLIMLLIIGTSYFLQNNLPMLNDGTPSTSPSATK